MKLTAEQYADATAKGFKAYWHNLDGFAEACFDTNVYDDLKDCKTATADETDMAGWEIDADEWRDAQIEAIELAMAHYEEENTAE